MSKVVLSAPDAGTKLLYHDHVIAMVQVLPYLMHYRRMLYQEWGQSLYNTTYQSILLAGFLAEQSRHGQATLNISFFVDPFNTKNRRWRTTKNSGKNGDTKLLEDMFVRLLNCFENKLPLTLEYEYWILTNIHYSCVTWI